MIAKTLTCLALMAMMLALPAFVLAQAQPPGPPVFGGTATLDGAPAPDFTQITAVIAGAIVASTSVTNGNYAFVIAQPPGVSYSGRTIIFLSGASRQMSLQPGKAMAEAS